MERGVLRGQPDPLPPQRKRQRKRGPKADGVELQNRIQLTPRPQTIKEMFQKMGRKVGGQ